jgi:Reverse transcriptase (RNA-dependent DNA polymerase)
MQGRGSRRVAGLLAAGYVHIVDADLKSYFDMIPKDRLKALIGRKVADGRILALIASFLEQGVLDGAREWTPEQGTPQGAVVSPLLSNIYLDPLDPRESGGRTGVRDGALLGRLRGDVPKLKRTPPQPWRWCSNGRLRPA